MPETATSVPQALTPRSVEHRCDPTSRRGRGTPTWPEAEVSSIFAETSICPDFFTYFNGYGLTIPEKLLKCFGVKGLVRFLNDESKSVIGNLRNRLTNTLARKQTTNDQPGKDKPQTAKQDHHFKRHRNERREGIPGPPAHIERPIPRAHPELEPERRDHSSKAAQKTCARQAGPLQAHHLIKPMYRVGREGITDEQAALPDSSSRLDEVFFAFEARHHRPSAHGWLLPTILCAPPSTPL